MFLSAHLANLNVLTLKKQHPIPIIKIALMSILKLFSSSTLKVK